MSTATLSRRRPSADVLPAAAEAQPLVLAIDLADEALAERLADILSGLPGLRLGLPGEAADVALVSPDRILPPASEGAGDANAADDWALTPRETQVLALLAEGASNKLIARRLAISVHTAKFHVGSLLDKLDATGRTDALAHAVRLGLIHL